MARNKIDIGSKEIYEAYIKDLDSVEKDTGYNVPRYRLNKAVHEINKRLMEEMLLHNRLITLPYGLGILSMTKFQPKLKILPNGTLNLPKDIPATMKLWGSDPIAKENKKYVYHRNQHTGGFVVKTKWENSNVKVKNITGYRFRPVKGFKRLIYSTLIDPLSKVDFYDTTKK